MATPPKNIRIYLRLRPPIDVARMTAVKRHKSGQTVTFLGTHNDGAREEGPSSYHFDHVFNADSRQEDVYEQAAKPCVDAALAGYNSTLFAYGQTASGKTHTISGSPEDPGMIPRALHAIYATAGQDPSRNIDIRVSFLQIYNERSSDLLNSMKAAHSPDELRKVTITDDDRQSSCRMQGLDRIPAPTLRDALQCFATGLANRAVASTACNRVSSRSHCVFTVWITQTMTVGANGEPVVAVASDSAPTTSVDGDVPAFPPAAGRRRKGDKAKTVTVMSKLHLVDLAGSERVSRSRSVGATLLEARHINLSLLYLEQVIVALAQRGRRKAGERGAASAVGDHIPYRNSALTQVLRDSLGGNCVTAMLATADPSAAVWSETASTCRFAQRVADVRQIPKVNLPTGDDVAALKTLAAAHARRQHRIAAAKAAKGAARAAALLASAASAVAACGASPGCASCERAADAAKDIRAARSLLKAVAVHAAAAAGGAAKAAGSGAPEVRDGDDDESDVATPTPMRVETDDTAGATTAKGAPCGPGCGAVAHDGMRGGGEAGVGTPTPQRRRRRQRRRVSFACNDDTREMDGAASPPRLQGLFDDTQRRLAAAARGVLQEGRRAPATEDAAEVDSGAGGVGEVDNDNGRGAVGSRACGAAPADVTDDVDEVAESDGISPVVARVGAQVASASPSAPLSLASADAPATPTPSHHLHVSEASFLADALMRRMGGGGADGRGVGAGAPPPTAATGPRHAAQEETVLGDSLCDDPSSDASSDRSDPLDDTGDDEGGACGAHADEGDVAPPPTSLLVVLERLGVDIPRAARRVLQTIDAQLLAAQSEWSDGDDDDDEDDDDASDASDRDGPAGPIMDKPSCRRSDAQVDRSESVSDDGAGSSNPRAGGRLATDHRAPLPATTATDPTAQRTTVRAVLSGLVPSTDAAILPTTTLQPGSRDPKSSTSPMSPLYSAPASTPAWDAPIGAVPIARPAAATAARTKQQPSRPRPAGGEWDATGRRRVQTPTTPQAGAATTGASDASGYMTLPAAQGQSGGAPTAPLASGNDPGLVGIPNAPGGASATAIASALSILTGNIARPSRHHSGSAALPVDNRDAPTTTATATLSQNSSTISLSEPADNWGMTVGAPQPQSQPPRPSRSAQPLPADVRGRLAAAVKGLESALGHNARALTEASDGSGLENVLIKSGGFTKHDGSRREGVPLASLTVNVNR